MADPHIVAPNGSPLAAAVIGVEDLAKTKAFYTDMCGFDVAAEADWSGAGFEAHWHLPPGASAKTALLTSGGLDVGRLLLMEFSADNREPIRPSHLKKPIGLYNINFYTPDIHGATDIFAAAGCHVWSRPTHYDMSDAAGAPTEVVFDGPDTVAINLVELTGDDPTTRVGQMRAYVQELGYNRKGFSPVVTTAHSVTDMDAATQFYEQVLHMGVLIDEVMSTAEQNNFLGLPEDGRTHVRFVQGNHMFGKVALSSPMNYECVDVTPTAHAPNIGYMAQMFFVADLDAAIKAAKTIDAEIYSPPAQLDIPGLGNVKAAMVRNPGSGALMELVER